MADRFSRGPQQRVQFQETSLQDMLTIPMMEQDKYDKVKAAQIAERVRLGNMNIRNLDAQYHQKLMDDLSKDLDDVSKQYNGDLAAASDSIYDRITDSAANPAWKNMQELYAQEEESRKLYAQSELNPELTAFDRGNAKDQALYNMDGSMNDIKYDVKGFKTNYRPDMEQYYNNMQWETLSSNSRSELAKLKDSKGNKIDPMDFDSMPDFLHFIQTEGIEIGPEQEKAIVQAYTSSGPGQEQIEKLILSGQAVASEGVTAEQAAEAIIAKQISSVTGEYEFKRYKETFQDTGNLDAKRKAASGPKIEPGTGVYNVPGIDNPGVYAESYEDLPDGQIKQIVRNNFNTSNPKLKEEYDNAKANIHEKNIKYMYDDKNQMRVMALNMGYKFPTRQEYIDNEDLHDKTFKEIMIEYNQSNIKPELQHMSGPIVVGGQRLVAWIGDVFKDGNTKLEADFTQEALYENYNNEVSDSKEKTDNYNKRLNVYGDDQMDYTRTSSGALIDNKVKTEATQIVKNINPNDYSITGEKGEEYGGAILNTEKWISGNIKGAGTLMYDGSIQITYNDGEEDLTLYLKPKVSMDRDAVQSLADKIGGGEGSEFGQQYSAHRTAYERLVPGVNLAEIYTPNNPDKKITYMADTSDGAGGIYEEIDGAEGTKVQHRLTNGDIMNKLNSLYLKENDPAKKQALATHLVLMEKRIGGKDISDEEYFKQASKPFEVKDLSKTNNILTMYYGY